MDEIRIIPTAEEYAERFHAAVDAVARERRYLAFVEAPPLESMRAFVRRVLADGVQMLAITKNDAVVGWCDIVRRTPESFRHVGTLGMGLLSDYRGRGLGERLAVETIRAAWAAGIERVELEVFASNERAIALYRKLGFITEGVKRRARKLNSQYDDNVFMALLAAPSQPLIRSAQPNDAPAAVHVMRRSIIELCVPDHRNDPATLELWLQNKTVDRFLAWLAHTDNYTVVAESGSEVTGIGMINRSGEVLLCYVLPGMEHRGVGRGILTALETCAREWDVDRLHLLSTGTARRFYEREGYISSGEPQPSSGIALGYPYEKRLPFQGS
jgi:ribosomal protein S18 acetylase RimI-like enzyme